MTGEHPAAAAILLDANLLLWAHHQQFDHHEPARAWLAETLSTVPVVGIPWPSILAFVRVSTHPRALERPLDARAARGVVEGWLERSNVSAPVPPIGTPRCSAICSSADARRAITPPTLTWRRWPSSGAWSW